jgi:UDPglucose 6-dehydrogenase
MNIAVIGAGYVGLVTGACFAELGNHVTCIDINAEKVAGLRKGILPIYEPGLEPLVMNNMKEGRLTFHTALFQCEVHPQVIFIAVGTPGDAQGAANIQYVLDAAHTVGQFIQQACVVVDKSTVPVGMADKVYHAILQGLTERNVAVKFDVVSNPEFLREGAAIEDFMRPDRVIIGLASNTAKHVMLDLYLPLLRNPERLLFMTVKDAEMTKYAANAMLATRISFMNEIALLCERLEVDIENVRLGIGSDARIGSAFLNAGCGYGGSCFPKDVRALLHMAQSYEVDAFLLQAVEQRNNAQKQVLSEKITTVFGEDLSGLTIAVWGLAFKPGTDDMREASSLALIEAIIARGGQVQAYDPVAMPVARQTLCQKALKSKKIRLCEHQYDALKQSDALVLVTEWQPFCYPDFNAMKNLMRQYVIFDGRNQYDPRHVSAAGFAYYGIGRGLPQRRRETNTAVA